MFARTAAGAVLTSRTVALAGPYVVACVLLVLAGAQKSLRPRDTYGALRAAGIGVSPGAVRVLGLVEAAFGIGGLTGRGAWLVAVAYGGFTAFVASALWRRTPLQSCGCLGGADVPPTVIHLVVDAFLAIAAIAIAVDGFHTEHIRVVPFVALVASTTFLTYVVLAILPTVRPAR